jgi:hypothetical protein
MSDRALAYARPIHPIYPLEFKYGARTLPVLEKVLSTLAEKDDWRKALWFGSVNSYLNNKMPKNVLKSRPQEILRVAEIEAARRPAWLGTGIKRLLAFMRGADGGTLSRLMVEATILFAVSSVAER